MSVRQSVALVLGVVAIVGVAAGCFDSNDTSRPEEICATMRNRLVDLELPADAPDRHRRADVMRRALGSEFVNHCARSIDRVQADCVMLASDPRAAHECMAGARETTSLATEAR